MKRAHDLTRALCLLIAAPQRRGAGAMSNKTGAGWLINRYEHLKQEPSDINEHLEILHKLAMECDSITEFGVRSGVSTTALLASFPVRYTGYDLKPLPEIKTIQEMARLSGVDAEFVVEDTGSAMIAQTDMLFIDSDHTCDHFLKELRQAPMVERYIVVHDTTTFPELAETCYAWLDTQLGYHWRMNFRFHNNNGLMVLARIGNQLKGSNQ